MNVLDFLNQALNSTQELQSLHQMIINSPYVKAAGLCPTPQQFCIYLNWLKMGVEYANDEWGEGALPAELRFFERRQMASGQIRTNFMSYITTPDGKED